MKLARRTSRLWALLYRFGLAHAPMTFWRVVVEAKLLDGPSRILRRYEAAVTAVHVWAHTVEEAEGLAALALQKEGLLVLTADAAKCAPAFAPKPAPMAVARAPLRYLPRLDRQAKAGKRPQRGARA